MDIGAPTQPLRVFFSSRMQELSYDRMLLIEAIHDAGDWPRFIENEPHRDKESIKGPIDSLIADSEAFVLVTYLTRGNAIELFHGHSPIEYELSRFVQGPGPVLWLVKLPPKGITLTDRLEFEMLTGIFARANGPTMRCEYSDPVGAKEVLAGWLASLPRREKTKLPRYIIRCTTADTIGQINLITQFLVEQRFNIDSIDQASRAGKATMYISVSQRSDEPIDVNTTHAKFRFERTLEAALRAQMLSQGMCLEHCDATVHIDGDDDPYSIPQISLEIRAMDVPGQLFSITRIIANRKLNIQRVDAQPAGPDHKHQMALRIHVAGEALENKDSAIEVLRGLEFELGRLIGVRSLTAHLLDRAEE